MVALESQHDQNHLPEAVRERSKFGTSNSQTPFKENIYFFDVACIF